MDLKNAIMKLLDQADDELLEIIYYMVAAMVNEKAEQE